MSSGLSFDGMALADHSTSSEGVNHAIDIDQGKPPQHRPHRKRDESRRAAGDQRGLRCPDPTARCACAARRGSGFTATAAARRRRRAAPRRSRTQGTAVTTQATVSRFLINPDGDVDGFLTERRRARSLPAAHERTAHVGGTSGRQRADRRMARCGRQSQGATHHRREKRPATHRSAAAAGRAAAAARVARRGSVAPERAGTGGARHDRSARRARRRDSRGWHRHQAHAARRPAISPSSCRRARGYRRKAMARATSTAPRFRRRRSVRRAS